jgi:hypothetical protein
VEGRSRESRKMLLIDGVKYELWTPPSEGEFEQVVEKHAEEIFGKDAKYFDLKHRLASRSGTGSIPDGYVIILGDKPKVQIIELELASHSLQHIVSQVVNIINGIENPTTQQKICNAIEDGINEDDVFAAKGAKAIKPVAIHRFLSDSFSNTIPMINIIIDKSSPELEEALNKITPPPKIIEFQTFVREGVGLAVHAHLFEPVYRYAPVGQYAIATEPQLPPQTLVVDSFKIKLVPEYIKDYYIYIPKLWKELFPAAMAELELDTDIGVIETRFNVKVEGNKYRRFLSGDELVNWFKAHPELKVGDKLLITSIEPGKKYRLEILP